VKTIKIKITDKDYERLKAAIKPAGFTKDEICRDAVKTAIDSLESINKAASNLFRQV